MIDIEMESNTTAGELVMPNDTLDEIEARWKDASAIRKAIARISVNSGAYVGYPSPLENMLSGRLLDRIAEEAAKVMAADAAALIEMVRARDAEIEQLHQIIDCLEWLKAKHDAALDTPPAQE